MLAFYGSRLFFIMDIFGKLRVIFWGCVIGIWGLFMYQYMYEDLNLVPVMPVIKNPFSGVPPAERVVRKTAAPAPYPPPPRASLRVKSASGMLLPLSGGLDTIAAGGADVQQAPQGFAMRETPHFVIYEEGAEVSKELSDTVERLHGDIMLDLVAFSPWTRDRKVLIYFAGSQSTYQRLTDRPAWSGGASSLSERKIYLFKSEEALGILTHELTHIYFDSFFSPENSPLWLSEGIATYIQSERGNSAPGWLKHNLDLLEKGGGSRLNDHILIETLTDADGDDVRIWYAQSYSIVRFLMKMKAGEAFYLFCKHLREGMPAHRALYQAYGMPYNKMSALEYSWRYDMKTGKISGANR
jgi:hypothetical protein